jgi:drug/metabolite transporter (DMT)-like permease
MPWQALISLQITLVAFATIITRLLARDKKLAKAGPAITAGWFVVLYAIGLLMLPHIDHVDHSAFTHYHWRFIGGAVAFAATNILFFYTMVYLDAAIGTIIGTISALFTVFGASILLHENLSNLQIAGTWLLLVSVIYGLLATRHMKNKHAHRKLMIGSLLAVIASVFYAIAALNEKALLGHVSIGSYIFYGWGLQMLTAVAVAIIFQPKELKVLLRPYVAGWTLGLGALRAISGLCFMMSLVRSDNVGLVTVISNFKLIIIILLGAWLLGEHTKMTQKLTAALGASIALGMLFWR